MTFYNGTPTGNQHADLEPARYVHLAINQIREIAEFYKTSDKPVHVMLVHVEMLLYILDKVPHMSHLVKQPEVKEWMDAFYNWFARTKLPAKHKPEIKQSADDLFARVQALKENSSH
ncbi:hypothetical protein [uncultured Chitinophaga sp.]|uniref:hypothetical protein n=1 Tax=uncultured Chitinophaga sp. TaxID=339340 RepID=UPI0025DA39FA|nr:hypothetical protein [uncultured Chitinophaga sp.]